MQAGKNCKLTITEVNGDQLIVDAGELGLIPLINNDLVLKYKVGETIDVFLFPEGENSTKGFIGRAFVQQGEFARLRVADNASFGSFMDIGLEKDLLCPISEQKTKMEINHYYLVYVYVDLQTNRLAASAKLDKYISKDIPELVEGDDVEIIVLNKTPLGYNAIVSHKYNGLLYDNEIFTELKTGQKLTAIVKKIREDNKIDLRLFRNDNKDINNFEKMILDYLKAHDGKMHINDESEPEEIYEAFGISKKNFKKALGALYRKELIDLKDTIVKLL